jgi:hypothetical protein
VGYRREEDLAGFIRGLCFFSCLRRFRQQVKACFCCELFRRYVFHERDEMLCAIVVAQHAGNRKPARKNCSILPSRLKDHRSLSAVSQTLRKPAEFFRVCVSPADEEVVGLVERILH